MSTIAELQGWIGDLDPSIAFLLALPFAVGLLGLAAYALEARIGRRRATTSQPRRGGHPVHAR